MPSNILTFVILQYQPSQETYLILRSHMNLTGESFETREEFCPQPRQVGRLV
jgi:hypothetical protein